jgi:hypothetical protein
MGPVMTAWLLILGTLAVLCLGAGTIVFCARMLARRRIDKAAGDKQMREWRALLRIRDVAEAAVDAVIEEVSSRPATYSTFPPELLQQLMAAHELSRQYGRNALS